MVATDVPSICIRAMVRRFDALYFRRSVGSIHLIER